MPVYTRRRAVATLSAAAVGGLVVPSYAEAAAHGRHGPGHGHGRHPHHHGPHPLRRAHAHNDYLHERPLLDAIDHGFGSVESDIWLVDGQLLVAHDESQLDPERTLERLYLDPLLRRVRANRGRVYRGHDLSLQLLIDLKTDGGPTYRALSKVLRRYRRIFSSAAHGRVRTRAVTAVISGHRGARAPMEDERLRYAFYDGRHEDINSGVPASFMPLISGNWNSSFRWRGDGEMPAAERGWLNLIVHTAHSQGQTVRFWATPDLPGPQRDAVWRTLLDADVDYLNTDDLAGLEKFLRGHDRGHDR